MRDLVVLTDYKSCFGFKHKAIPFQSGMDKEKMTSFFREEGFHVTYKNFSDIDFKNTDYAGSLILYTSSEDKGFHYKDFIEDIVWGLELNGAVVIPEFKYLRANNNKVFMEILRDSFDDNPISDLPALYFGTYEDMRARMESLEGQMVLKTARGAMSKGVSLGKNEIQVKKIARKYSRSPHYFAELWDIKNRIKHQGFKKDSLYRNKFVVQRFVPGLDHDWKVLVYGSKIYVLLRENRTHDFRASGSGKFRYTEDLPAGMLDFAWEVFSKMNVPNVSLDIVYDGKRFYVLEFQAIHFGTKTIENSDFSFNQTKDGWITIREKPDLEKVYVASISTYIKDQKLL